MSCFIKASNLPEGKVSDLICGSSDNNVLDFFKNNNITVIKNARNPRIDPCVSSHADMAALYLGEGLILLDKNQRQLKNELLQSGCRVIETGEEVEGAYPGDVRLNFTAAGEQIIGNFSFADSKLLELSVGKNKINVKQGYCKCSTLVVNKNAIITDDPSIHRVTLKNGIDSLLISKGDICLDGHEYGFIGGASGKISHDTVVFFGDIEKHRDFEKIKAFLLKYGCDYVSTDKLKLRDIGGIIAIKEKI